MSSPLRVLLDTNIYGVLIEQHYTEKFLDARKNGKAVFYGYDVIWHELRDISKTKEIDQKNYRIIALDFYDRLILKHHYENVPLIDWLADQYSIEYVGGISKKKTSRWF